MRVRGGKPLALLVPSFPGSRSSGPRPGFPSHGGAGRSPSRAAGADGGSSLGRGWGGYLREGRQHREHHRCHEHPAGGEAALAMPPAGEVAPSPPVPPQGMLSPAPTRYSRQGRMDRDGLSHREAHEDPGEGRGHISITERAPFPFWGLLPSPCPPIPASSGVSRGLTPPLAPLPGASPRMSCCPIVSRPPLHPLLLAEGGPRGLQHSPSAQERRSPRGCRARPRRKDKVEGPAPGGEGAGVTLPAGQGWRCHRSSPWGQRDQAHPWHHPDH